MLSWEPKENKVISFMNWWLRGLAVTWGTSRTEVLLLQMKWWLILLKQNFHSKFIGCHFPKRHQSMRPDGEWCASQLTACPLLRVPAQHPDNSQQGWADWKHEEYASRMPCRSLFGCSQCYPSWLSTGLQLLMLLLTTGLAVDCLFFYVLWAPSPLSYMATFTPQGYKLLLHGWNLPST